MALFTDAQVIAIDDLLRFEASIGQVAAAQGIDVNGKIALATSDIAERLKLWLLAQYPYAPNWFNPWLNSHLLNLGTVVTTPALQRWLCVASIAKIFAEAYNAQLNTRFQAKWQQYLQEADNSAEMAFRGGLGIVSNPLNQPPLPLLSVQSGGLAAQTLFIQTTWVDAKGNESAPSPASSFTLGDASGITVAIVANFATAPAAAAGWNIYAGELSNTVTRQNAAAIAMESTWQMPATGLAYGAAPGSGQKPDYYIQLSRQRQRG